MVKLKYRESYSFQKYNSDIPIRLSFLTANLYRKKLTHTREEKNNIVQINNKMKKVYEIKKSVHNELMSKSKTNIFAFIIFKNKLFNFIRQDNYNSNGWINLYCIEINKIISCRYCDDRTMYVHSKCLIGKYNQKLFLNRKKY